MFIFILLLGTVHKLRNAQIENFWPPPRNVSSKNRNAFWQIFRPPFRATLLFNIFPKLKFFRLRRQVGKIEKWRKMLISYFCSKILYFHMKIITLFFHDYILNY